MQYISDLSDYETFYLTLFGWASWTSGEATVVQGIRFYLNNSWTRTDTYFPFVWRLSFLPHFTCHGDAGLGEVLLAASIPLLFDLHGNKSPLPLRRIHSSILLLTTSHCFYLLNSWPLPFFIEDFGNCRAIFLSTPIPPIVMGNIYVCEPPNSPWNSFSLWLPMTLTPLQPPTPMVIAKNPPSVRWKLLYPTMT